MSRRRIPQLIHGKLIVSDQSTTSTILFGSVEWRDWVADQGHTSFSLPTQTGTITLRRERQRNNHYWYAYRWYDGRLHKSYIGKSEELTAEWLSHLTSSEEIILPSTEVQYFFLGTSHIHIPGRHGQKFGNKALLLLAYLATHTTPQPRGHLIALLWPDSTEQAARKNLRNLLWTLHTLCGDKVVLVKDDSLLLRQTLSIDIWHFERLLEQWKHHMHDTDSFDRMPEYIAHSALLREAFECYQGPFLDGIAIAESIEAEHWLLLERERLGQMFLRVCTSLIETFRFTKDWSRLLLVAQRALAEEPLHEPLYQATMEAYAQLGQRAEALHQYEMLRTLLERELGVSPLPKTDVLYKMIRSGELYTAISEQRMRTPSIAPSPFVARREELTVLDEELRHVQQGQARAVLLTGELGIGKSRLWQEWKMRLPAQATVLDLRCFEINQMLPQGPLVDWFRRSSWLEQLFAPSSPLSAVWREELLRLVPASSSQDQPLHSLQIAERSHVFEALAQSLLVFGMQPCVLFLDDAHWADTFTLDWLSYLMDRFAGGSLLLLLAYRREEVSAPLASHVASWTRKRITRHLTLPRLTRQESHELIHALGGDSQRAEHAYTQGAGNPYFLSELLHAAPGTIPPTLADLVRARLDAFPEEIRQILQTAVILEPDIDFVTLQRTSGRNEEETLHALDTLLHSAILLEQQEQYSFTHPLVAQVIRDTMGNARRKLLHRRGAQALEMIYAGQLPMISGRLAYHYEEAGDSIRAATYLDMAAEIARVMGAWNEVMQLSEHAIALHATPGRQFLLGQALFWQGQFDGARKILVTALQAAGASETPQEISNACLSLATIALLSAQDNEAEQWIQRGLKAHGYNDSSSISLIGKDAILHFHTIDYSPKQTMQFLVKVFEDICNALGKLEK